MKLDPKALDTSAVGLNGWMADADKTPAARAVIERYLTAIGETHVIVPREATEEMIGEGDRVMYGRYGCSFSVEPIYRAMLATAKEGE